ncbi:hypothetical protein GGI42DRAFT_327153 [Trichoderma sp. SZMC 28013]
METRGVTAARSRKQPAIPRRSCDQCRARKIACDRGSPCSSCDNAKIRCTHTSVVSRAKEAGQRILISAKYERKFDEISEGIDEIKKLLQERSSGLREHQPHHTANSDSPLTQDTIESGRQSPCPFTGGSSFTAHSLEAKRFVESIAAQTTLEDSDLERDDLLACLRDLLRHKNDEIVVHQISFSDEPHPMCTTSKTKNLPPLDAAVFILRWAKENPSNYIVTWLSHILPLERLIEICQKVYFSVNGYTEVDFILANGSFYWLYAEYAIISKQPKFHEYSRQCCENFQDAFSRLPFLLPASMEVIAALAMGSLHAIELCKDLLAWTFSSSASHLCQTLGFHQNSFLEHDREDIKKAKQRLFFTIYRIDKSLSLRLGRSSNIQEYNVPLPCEYMDMRWNKSANIQGRVYDELYSSFGLSRSYSDRLHSVKSLSGEIQMLIDGFDHTISSINTDVLLKAHLAAEQVELLSVLTLIHRAVLTPDSGISPDCFEAASKAMDAHQYAIATLQACTDEPTTAARYINRIILNMPFVPFIVLFRQCIEASNPIDLARLCDFVTSLQPLEFSSKPARSRQRLFQLLHKVARLYVESGSSPKVWNQGLTDDEFNHYLNILGFTTTVSSSDPELMPTITDEFTSEMIS